MRHSVCTFWSVDRISKVLLTQTPRRCSEHSNTATKIVQYTQVAGVEDGILIFQTWWKYRTYTAAEQSRISTTTVEYSHTGSIHPKDVGLSVGA